MKKPILTNISNRVALLTIVDPTIKLSEQIINYQVPDQLDYVIVDTGHRDEFWKMMCYHENIDYVTRKKLHPSGRIKKLAAKTRHQVNLKEES